MANKPELRRAVAGSKIKANDYNYNFEQLNNYIENGIADNAINKYEADREYSKDDLVSVEIDGVFGIYRSLVNGNKGKSLLDENFWKRENFVKDFEERFNNFADGRFLSSPFTVNSGNTDENGNADLLYLPSVGVSTSCYFKVGGDYSNLVATNTEKTFEKSYLEPLNVGEGGSRTYETWLPVFTSSSQDDITITPADSYTIFGQDGSYNVASGKTVDFIVDFGKETNVKGVDFEGFPFTYNTRHECYFQGLYGTNDLLDEWVEILPKENVLVKQTDIDVTYRYYKFPIKHTGATYPSTVKRLNLKYVKTEYFADNNYNVFVSETENPYALTNNIYRQKTEPTAVENDVWLNTAVQPYKAYKYTGSEWIEFSDVPIGSMVVSGGIITSVETFPYNNTSIDKPENIVVVETYQNDESWYRIWSDGWCEQGGYYVPTSVTSIIGLLKSYINTKYSITTGMYYKSNTSIYSAVVGVTKTKTDFSIYIPTTDYRVYWQTCGYIK